MDEPIETRQEIKEQLSVIRKKRNPFRVGERHAYDPTNSPYYKKEIALEVKALLDKMPADRSQEMELNPRKYNINRETLKSRINQGFAYLVDYLDTPEGTYADLRTKIVVSLAGSRIRLRWRYQMSKLVDDVKMVEPEASKTEGWRIDLEHYIDNAQENEKFDQKFVGLTLDDLQYVRDSLEGVQDVFHIIELKHTRITLIKNSTIGKEA